MELSADYWRESFIACCKAKWKINYTDWQTSWTWKYGIFHWPCPNTKLDFITQVSIDTPGRPKAGVERMKKANLKIDMTPMVDLGFLLISFFIFTTEVSKPAITNLFMPKDGDSTKVPQSKSLTILLDNNDQIFYYNGDMNEAIKNNQIFQTSYNEINGIGNVIRQKQNQLAKRKTDKKELVILIKPFTNTSYRNVVDILDEMLINEVTRYMIADPENEEKMFLERQNRNR